MLSLLYFGGDIVKDNMHLLTYIGNCQIKGK